MVPAAFKDVEKTREIRSHVDMGVFDAVTDTGLGCEVDHRIEPLAGEDLLHAPAVGKVQLPERELTV